MSESENKRSNSGLARAEALTPERRIEIAKQGAVARWGYKATHKGNFKDDFGIDADCYILNDDKKTAVMSQSGMAALLGLVRRGNSLSRLIKQIAPYAEETGARLLEKLANPIIFQWHGPAHGLDVMDLIDVCNAVLISESKGYKFLSGIVVQAHLIKTASEKSGIQNLAWRVAGYDPTREEVINAFKDYIAQEACEYAKEFPRALYEGWCRIYNLRETKIHSTFSYWEPKARFRKLTLDQIYHPMAGSDGVIKDLVLKQRAESENPKGKRLFQFLSDVLGKPVLRMQIGQILSIQKLSKTQEEYEKNFATVFGKPPN